jgi:hypothetical protein
VDRGAVGVDLFDTHAGRERLDHERCSWRL